MIYLDYAATSKISEKSREIQQYIDEYYPYNPHSLHTVGLSAGEIIANAREAIASRFNLSPEHVLFTSSGSEANRLVIDLYINQTPPGEPIHIISSDVEHGSTYYYLKLLEKRGIIRLTFLPIGSKGQIDLEALENAIASDTKLVTIQHTNSETGCVQPIEKIARVLKAHNIPLHSDCVQAVDALLDENWFNQVQACTISGHKINGPKGSGMLLLNPFKKLIPLYENKQQYGFTQGTLSPSLIASSTQALFDFLETAVAMKKHTETLRHYFIEQVNHKALALSILNFSMQSSHIIGCLTHRLNGEYIMQTLSRHDIFISTQSACSDTNQENRSLSHLNQDAEASQRFIRISLGVDTTKHEIDTLIHHLKNIL